jgi:hypothetical protein
MNGTPIPEPLAPDVVDELLSALVDGEFDAAAVDAGMTPDEARARLAATPGVAERTRALEAARAELANVPPLDAVTRRRLVHRALPAEYHEDRNRVGRWLLGTAGAAAAIALVFALLTLPAHDDGGDASSSGAGKALDSAATTTSPRAPSSGARVEDERALQGYVAASRANNFQAAPSAPADEPATSAPPEAANNATTQSQDKALRSAALAASPRCTATIVDEFGLADARVAQTTAGTHAGKPAIVVIFTRDNGVLGFLYDPATCKVLISTFSK